MASDAGAHQGDDFVVPAGETWTVTQVVLSGQLGMETLPSVEQLQDTAA